MSQSRSKSKKRRTKVSASNVVWIRKMRARHHISYARLGRCVGCSAQHARDIVHGNRRANVK